MKLKRERFVSKLYQWFYNKTALPQTLCSYGPKSLLMWLVLVPYVLLSIPIAIIEYTDHKNFKPHDNWPMLARPILGGFMWLALFLVVGMISIFFVNSEHVLFGAGVSGWVITGAILVLWLWDKYNNWRQDRKWARKQNEVPYTKKPSLIKEWFKAKKEKYCTKIEWI